MDQNFLWNNISVQEATKGVVYGKWHANGISIDSRKIKSDDIFIAFKGENVDGHDYLLEALAKGSAAIVERIPQGFDPTKYNIVLVKDGLKALKDLASYNRNRSKAKIIAVTGSVGKTSTKEQLNLAFAAIGKTYCSSGNYNSYVGSPLSMACMSLDTEYGIFELGMSFSGEMSVLTKIVRPHVSIITIIAPCHIENFDSIEGIAKAKSEIFLGMDKSGVAILNGDTTCYSILESEAKKNGIKKIIKFGEDSNNQSILISYKRRDDYSDIKAKIISKEINYQIASYGKHHAINSVAVLSAVAALNLDIERAALGLKEFANFKGRGALKKIKVGDKNNILLIDDSYNASPASVRAALDVLKEIHGYKRKLVVLADMNELGSISADEHRNLLQSIQKNGVDKVITVGTWMKELFKVLPEENRLEHFDNYKDAIIKIENLLENEDCLLVKGSFGTKIHELVKYIEEKQ